MNAFKTELFQVTFVSSPRKQVHIALLSNAKKRETFDCPQMLLANVLDKIPYKLSKREAVKIVSKGVSFLIPNY